MMSGLIQIETDLTTVAAMTAPDCGSRPECLKAFPDSKYRCCAGNKIYCESARAYTKRVYQIDLTDAAGHPPDLPFMSPTGCTLLPKYRPICAIHTCRTIPDRAPEYQTLYNSLHARTRNTAFDWWQDFNRIRDNVQAEVK